MMRSVEVGPGVLEAAGLWLLVGVGVGVVVVWQRLAGATWTTQEPVLARWMPWLWRKQEDEMGERGSEGWKMCE